MIDLHLHTTASDGEFHPRDVVSKAWHAGLRTIAITDHDTVAGLAEAEDAGRTIGVRVIPGIEITAVTATRDVHVLGYFLNRTDPALLTFLANQRADRIARVREIARRLDTLGMRIDVDAVLAPYAGRPDRAVGRPAVARALVAAGHVGSVAAAFERLIGSDGPAFVPVGGRLLSTSSA
jgi:predicted metal-dependent phosphoesterase TrpH